MGKKSKIVFSTDPDYNEELEQPVVTQAKEQQQLRVWRQRLGGGRVVTIVKGVCRQ